MWHNGKYPAWGVLVQASLEQVRFVLSGLGDRFDLTKFVCRVSGEWTAVFNMEPGDTSDDVAAERLLQAGLAPVYRFDLNRYEYCSFKWDGEKWSRDKDPGAVLRDVGIEIPGWDEALPPNEPSRGIVAHEASVIIGCSVDDVRGLVEGREIHVVAGPRGAIVYDADVHTRISLWSAAPRGVLDVLCYPSSGYFKVRTIQGEDCLGTFVPGETRTWDGTPFLDNVEGARTAEEALDRLGIPHSFLRLTSTESTDSTHD